MKSGWDDLDAGASGDVPWELFHESSKTTRCHGLARGGATPSAGAGDPLSFDLCPRVALPEPSDLPISRLLQRRAAPAEVARPRLCREDLSTLLSCAHRLFAGGAAPEAPRAVETFLHARAVEGLRGGLYHYGAARHELRTLCEGDQSAGVLAALSPHGNAAGGPRAPEAPLSLFVVALLERAVAGAGDRGYRAALIEAGRLAQSVHLAAGALGVGCADVGGYIDDEIDALLGLDGLSQSTIWVAAVGGARDRSARPDGSPPP